MASQLKHKVESSVAFSVAIDESTDSAEFVEVVSMTDTRTAEDILTFASGCLDTKMLCMLGTTYLCEFLV